MIVFNLLKQGFKDVWFMLNKMSTYLIVWLDINTSFPWCETITIMFIGGFLYCWSCIMLSKWEPVTYGPSKYWMDFWRNKF